MPKFKIKHTTKYTYKTPVRDSANQIVLFPVNDEYQEVLKHELKISGEPPVEVYKDYYGNEVGTFTHCEPHSELLIMSKLQVVTVPRPLPLDDIFANEQWELLDKIKHNIPYVDYLKQEHFEGLGELKEIASYGNTSQETPFDVAKRFNQYVFENFKYIPGITTVETTLDQIWKLRAGVCQDFAHILLVMLRLRSIPARYVSGYICPHKNGMRGEGATHAWAEAYIPNYGWLGFDPTNNCVANETHVRLAVGRNFPDCTPVKGVYKGGAEHKLEVRVTVSYGNEEEEKEPEAIPVAITTGTFPINSFQQHLEMMQQQQQQ
ncbi:transglutaminase family protein [Desertivirga arenae]|uniref:transglutaminase family protein n=1 Tax=Desertivirga arenae TaxID=2810309 RepID=UPI001A95FF34|nr:transglutaminase family protein [Pedobacter sp. SYSU D00823]